jgi:hypothetical protein
MSQAVRAGRPYAALEPPVFGVVEIAIAAGVAVLIQVSFFVVLIAAGAADARITAKQEAMPVERPISVKPILDEAPLLKLGGKKRAKLPDMWKKQKAVKRYEEASAPSPLAEKTPEAIPTSPLVKADAEAPPPDADLAKKVDEDIKLMDATAPPEPQVEGEGSPDGVKEGTETDPLKARAVSLYRAKIIAWFNARFRVPAGQIPCDELKKLSSRVSANVSPDGTVTGFSVGNPSGNATFDARVQSAMQGSVGQQVPPPPPLYPDVLPPAISLNFTGSSQKCE